MKPALCVVIHDVADARLAGCERVLAARCAHGDELTLHGCTHLDDGTPVDGFDRLRRRV